MSSPTVVWAHRNLISNLARRDLKAKYKKSLLGWLWSLINPAATLAVYTFVFGVILKGQAPVAGNGRLQAFPLYLFAVGYWWRHHRQPSWRFALAINALLLLLYFTHLVSLLAALVTVGVLWLWSARWAWRDAAWRRHLVHPLVLLPQLALPLGYVLAHPGPMRQGRGGIGEDLAYLARLGPLPRFHVSFDADVLDPEIAPGVGTPVPGGFTYREAHLLMELFADSGRVTSLDLVEVNPILDRENRTANLLVELAASLLGKKIY